MGLELDPRVPEANTSLMELFPSPLTPLTGYQRSAGRFLKAPIPRVTLYCGTLTDSQSAITRGRITSVKKFVVTSLATGMHRTPLDMQKS